EPSNGAGYGLGQPVASPQTGRHPQPDHFSAAEETDEAHAFRDPSADCWRTTTWFSTPQRRSEDERRLGMAPHPARLLDHLPLAAPTVDDGAGLAHRAVQVARPAAPRRVLRRGRPVLGPALRPELRDGR